MIYLLLGEDGLAKDQAISTVKQKYLPTEEAVQFDYEVLHGIKLDPDDLQKALLNLPAVAKKRLVVLRQVDKLSAQNQKLVEDFIRQKSEHADLILDTQEADADNAFLKRITPLVKSQRFGRSVRQSVFDMTNAIAARNGSEALKILDDILEKGDQPLQILGAMVWFWGKQRGKVSAERFKKGLLMLQEADINIKRSRIKPEYSLEVLVTKLSALITG